MTNWLERLAIQDDEFRRSGGELWRNFKLACETIVDSYNQIYGTRQNRQFEVSNGEPASDNCFRVRYHAPPGSTERYVEARFTPERKRVSFLKFPSGTVPGQPPMPTEVTVVAHAQAGLSFTTGATLVSLDDLTQSVLSPLFFPAGIRPEPIHPPRPTER